MKSTRIPDHRSCKVQHAAVTTLTKGAMLKFSWLVVQVDGKYVRLDGFPSDCLNARRTINTRALTNEILEAKNFFKWQDELPATVKAFPMVKVFTYTEYAKVPSELWTDAIALMNSGHERLGWEFVDKAWQPGFAGKDELSSKKDLIKHYLRSRLQDSVYAPGIMTGDKPS